MPDARAPVDIGPAVKGLYGGSGNDALNGDAGNDFIDGFTVSRDPANPEQGKDRIYCGAGRDDQVVANPFDYVAPDCEHVSRDGIDGG
ncbi:MAG: hypothetical protein WKF95_14930 [Rubrobacter sp.]